jgi:hypothetical protein
MNWVVGPTESFTPRTFWDLAARDSRRAAVRASEILANQEAHGAILAAVHATVAGESTDAIKQLIAENHADTVTRFIAADEERDRMREQLTELGELLEQVGSGDLAADEFVDAVARRLARSDDDQ